MTDIVSSCWASLQSQRHGRHLLLFLDYDGTLVEIAPRPELARPTPELLTLLERLLLLEDLKLFIVSGRPAQQLQDLLPVSGLNFIGSHGGEAVIAGRPHPLLTAVPGREALSRRRRWLATHLQYLQGWWIEDKPLGFALHYRQVPPSQTKKMMAILQDLQEKIQQEGGFQILAGKMVLEILPPGVSKGEALREILLLPEFNGFYPLYLGDDTTDESAFLILKGRGLTIKVGSHGCQTAASLFLPDPAAVRYFLSLLAESKEEL